MFAEMFSYDQEFIEGN